MEIWEAICDLESQVNHIDTEDLQQQIDDLTADQILGYYTIFSDVNDRIKQPEVDDTIAEHKASYDFEDQAISAGHANNGGGNIQQNIVIGNDAFVSSLNVQIDEKLQAQVTCVDFDPQHVP